MVSGPLAGSPSSGRAGGPDRTGIGLRLPARSPPVKNQRLDYELLAESLRDRQLVSSDALNHVLHQVQSTGALFSALLVKDGLISDYELSRVSCDVFGLPFLPVDQYAPDKALLPLLDAEFLRHYALVPLDKRGKLVVMALPGMVPAEVLVEAEALLQAKIVPVVGTVEGNQRWLEDNLPPPQALQIDMEAESSEWASVLDMGDTAVQNVLEAGEQEIPFDPTLVELEASLGLLDIAEDPSQGALRRSSAEESLEFELPKLLDLGDDGERGNAA